MLEVILFQELKQWGTKENRRSVLQVAWPAVLESFFVALAGMVDSLMVSRVGAHAVAAVGLTTQPKFIGLAFFIALNVSVSALTARRKGGKDRRSANQILVMAMLAAVIMGVIVSAVCVIFADPIISLCGSGADTHEAAVEYFRIIMGCIMFTVISLAINAAQRGAGNTKIAMRTNITSNVINVACNYLLIEGNLGFPAMGVRGAAIATVLGTVVACVMSILSLFIRDNYVSAHYIIEEKIRPALETAKSMFKISSNVLVEQLLIRIGFLSVAVMAAKLGTAAFAAHQVGMNVMSLSFSFGDGMQVAAVTLIGQSLGASEPEIAKLYGSICQNIGKVIAAILAVIYLLGGGFLYRLFFSEPEIVAMGVQIMRVIVVIVLLQISQVIYMGCLRGAGDVVFTTIASTISVTLIRPAASYLFCYVFSWGVIGIWLGVVADQLMRYALTGWRFRSGKWMGIKI